MKKINLKKILGMLCLLGSVLLFSIGHTDDWGFYGHRRINRMAVFTLPQDMMVFYKKNIEYITEHAVDPDKRRYATKHEGVRHYIDIDHWGEYPFAGIPRSWSEVMMKYTDIYMLSTTGDTLHLFGKEVSSVDNGKIIPNISAIKTEEGSEIGVPFWMYKKFIINNVLNQYYEDEWLISCDSLQRVMGIEKGIECDKVFAVDRFSAYGILPYHLIKMQRKLTKAFKEKDSKKILRLSAEFGHYIGDAHVPLHTTENYNGQMTNQVGIHAFWESRIPELFADENYDFFVGQAEYFDNTRDYYWDIILTSHSYIDSVFAIEKQLSETYPQNEQYCFEERLERTVRTECKAYAAAYSKRLEGQVEQRMQGAIHAIGSAWFTAWVDAGQPDLSKLDPVVQFTKSETKEKEEVDASFKRGLIKGRTHGE